MYITYIYIYMVAASVAGSCLWTNNQDWCYLQLIGLTEIIVLGIQVLIKLITLDVSQMNYESNISSQFSR